MFWNGILSRGWSAAPPSTLTPPYTPSTSASTSVGDFEETPFPPPCSSSYQAPAQYQTGPYAQSAYLTRPRAPSFTSLPRTPTDYDDNEVASCRTATEICYDEEEFEDDADDEMGVEPLPADHPARFERRYMPDGQPFFVDHHLQITSWEPVNPRKQTLRRKAKYVREQVFARMRAGGGQEPMHDLCRIIISRDDMFESSFGEIARKTPDELRCRLRVIFNGEEGVDAGGLTREFFHLISSHISNPAYGLFHAPSSEHPDLLSINPLSSVNPAHLDYFRVVGRIIGLALLGGEKVSVGFAGVVWKLLVGGLESGGAPTASATAARTSSGNDSGSGSSRRRRRRSDDDDGRRHDTTPYDAKRRKRAAVDLDDLKGVDDTLGKSLQWVRENDPSVLCRSFAHEVERFGETVSIELQPGGEQIEVTEENKEDYVQMMARFVLLENVRPQTEAMLKGLYEVVPLKYLVTLRPEELELLICGISGIDVNDWQANTVYRNGYSAHSPTIQMFWEYVRTLSSDRLDALLLYATGSPRLPPGGFAYLKGSGGELHRFTITLDRRGTDRLPCAHTCFNEIDLPPYATREQVARAVNIAISETSSFDIA